MSSTPRKCIALRQAGTQSPGNSQDDYRFAPGDRPSVASMFAATGTKWIRMWAWWPGIQPTAAPIVVTGDQAWPIRAVDDQVAAARADGLRIILTLWKFPKWANGANSTEQVPNDVGPNSAWGQWFRFMYSRYEPSNPANAGRTIDVLEVCNEPNLAKEMLPAKDASGVEKPMHVSVRDMFRTARDISAEFGHTIHLGGPALTDKNDADSGEGSDWISYVDFMNDFLALEFKPHSRFIWTEHNYRDVEVATGSTWDARNRLLGSWSGYSEGGGPCVFATEGGARLSRLGDSESAQAAKTEDIFTRLRARDGIGMQTNYMLYDSPTTTSPNSGLRDSYVSGGSPRQVYQTWADEPTGGPVDLNTFRTWTDLGTPFKWGPAVCSMHPGNVEVFAVSTLNSAIYRRSLNGSTWSAWAPVSFGVGGGPAAESRQDGKMDVFVRGTDNALVWMPYSNGTWQTWTSLGGVLTSDPAVCSLSSTHLQVFVRGSDGQIWFRRWNGSTWAAWTAIPGAVAAGGPTAIARGGEIHVYVRDSNDQLRHTRFNGTNWSAWDLDASGNPFQLTPEAVSWGTERADIFVHGNDHRIWRKVQEHGFYGSWEPMWTPGPITWGPGATSQENGSINLVWIDGDRVRMGKQH